MINRILILIKYNKQQNKKKTLINSTLLSWLDLGDDLHEKGRGRRKEDGGGEGKRVGLDVDNNNMKGGEWRLGGEGARG